MSDNIRYQVFISSTYEDLKSHRDKAFDAILSIGDIPVGMEMFLSSDDESWEIIKKTIDLSDYYIVIIGGRYGSLDKDGIGFTEKEYDYAVSKGVPVLGFIHKNPDKLPRDCTELDQSKNEKLEAFKAKVKSRRNCTFWENESDLIRDVICSYVKEKLVKPRPGWIRGDNAKTKEDYENIESLRKKISELENTLCEYKSRHTESDILTQEMNDSIEIKLSDISALNGKDKSCLTNYNELFLHIGRILIIERKIPFPQAQAKLANFIYEKITNDKLINIEVYLNCTLVIFIKIFNYFLIRNLIEETTENNQMHFQKYRITDTGRKHILHLERLPNITTVISD